MEMETLSTYEKVDSLILTIRGQKVILDSDLAKLYGVSTAALNQAIRRNLDRFPYDFAFSLTVEERMEVITNCDHLEKLKYSRTLPIAFSEHGAIMAASVLKSAEAVRTSVFVVRAFVKMRETLTAGAQIGTKLSELEQRIEGHDEDIEAILETIRRLIDSGKSPARRIGFGVGDRGK